MATTKTAQAARKPADKPDQPAKCRCGCGEQVTKQYKPGHDARHASQLRQAVAEGKLTRDAALKVASDTSPAFVAKVTRSLDNLAREQESQAEKADAK
jgi:hypothetical protein